MVKIILNGDLGRGLASLTVGRASAFEALVVGVPDGLENVQIHFGTGGDTAVNAACCDEKPGGEWYCYANGAYFPRPGKNHYHVTARNGRGDSVYLGGGTLFVEQSVLNMDAADAGTIPDDTWLRGLDGKYYKLTVEFDADGVPVPVVDDEGVTR